MEPEKNTGPEIMGEPEEKKEEKKPALSVKATFWVTVALLIIAVALMVVMLVGFADQVVGVFVVCLFLLAIINRACWKCPACQKHLGRFGYPKNCPHCGEDLKM